MEEENSELDVGLSLREGGVGRWFLSSDDSPLSLLCIVSVPSTALSRPGQSRLTTPRNESDTVEILSGPSVSQSVHRQRTRR